MLVCRVPFSLNFFLPYIFTLIIIAYGFCVFAKKINFQKLVAEREAFALSSSEGFEWKSESSDRNRMGHTCAVCGNRSYLRCSVCKAVRYCSGICQIKHWKSGHKAECEVIQPARGIHLTQTLVTNQGRTAWETSGSELVVKNPEKNMVYEDITQQREQEDDLSGETEPREVDGYGIFKSFSGEHTGYFQGLGAGPRPPKSTAHIQAQLDAQQREVEQARKELDEVLAILKEVQSQMQNERQLRKKMQTQFLAHMEHQRAMQEQLQVSISFQIQEAMQTTLSLSRSFSVCMICLTNEKDLAFGCGHMICRECGSRLSNCPLCRKQITCRLRLFPQ